MEFAALPNTSTCTIVATSTCASAVPRRTVIPPLTRLGSCTVTCRTAWASPTTPDRHAQRMLRRVLLQLARLETQPLRARQPRLGRLLECPRALRVLQPLQMLRSSSSPPHAGTGHAAVAVRREGIEAACRRARPSPSPRSGRETNTPSAAASRLPHPLLRLRVGHQSEPASPAPAAPAARPHRQPLDHGGLVQATTMASGASSRSPSLPPRSA